jgi:hypothetical protein
LTAQGEIILEKEKKVKEATVPKRVKARVMGSSRAAGRKPNLPQIFRA